MYKKLALMLALTVPASAFAAPYLLVGGAMGKTDLGDVEELYSPFPVETDENFGRALIGVGADINPNLGIEALYMTEAEATLESKSSGEKDVLKNSGFQFAVLGKAPLTPQFSLFGKLSANYLEVQDEYTNALLPSGNETQKDSKFQLGFGIGAHYQVSDAVGLRLTAERIQIRDAIDDQGDSDMDQASLAVTFSF